MHRGWWQYDQIWVCKGLCEKSGGSADVVRLVGMGAVQHTAVEHGNTLQPMDTCARAQCSEMGDEPYQLVCPVAHYQPILDESTCTQIDLYIFLFF